LFDKLLRLSAVKVGDGEQVLLHEGLV